jgi:hypothetical protein
MNHWFIIAPPISNVEGLYGCYMIIKDEIYTRELLDLKRLETQKYPSTLCSDIYRSYPFHLTIKENIVSTENNDSGSI